MFYHLALVRVMTNILILACQMQAKASIPYLLDEGATIDGAGDVNQQSLVCKLVIGGGVYASDVFKNSAITARSAAVASDTVEIIQLILDHIKDDSILEVADAFGRTALHYAAIKGHATIARFIVQRLKASRWGCTSGNIIGSTKLDSECHTALFYAVVGGHTDIVDALTDVDGVNVDDLTVGMTWLRIHMLPDHHTWHRAVSVEPPSATTITPSATWHPQLAVGYIPRSYGQSQTPLALACKFNNADIVKLLLARGASPNFVDEDGIEVAGADFRCLYLPFLALL